MGNCCRKKEKKRESYPEVYCNDRATNHALHFPVNFISSTKYTWWNFLFKNIILEQFRRLNNFYFLIIAIISSIPQISPFSAVSSWLPLIVVLAITAIKDGIEDYMRYRADKELNNRPYQVLQRGGDFITLKNMEIHVGDVVKVMQDQEVPADMVIIRSAKKDGVVFVDTANLDGEINLKQFRAMPDTVSLSTEEVRRVGGIFACEPPNVDLRSFIANFRMAPSDPEKPLDGKNLLLRGCRVRNTKHVIGCVVYAGKETKLALNANAPPSKFSQMDKAINRVTLFLFCIKLLVVIGCTIGNAVLGESLQGNSFYFGTYTDSVSLRAFLAFWSYFAIFSYFIPISIVVSLEVAKLFQAVFMMWDVKMLGESGDGLTVKNSNLNDELARTEYIFSDKTGTLTENKMEFDKASIAGKKYSQCRSGELRQILDAKKKDPTDPEFQAIYEYLLLLAICNAAVPNTKTKDSKTKSVDTDTGKEMDALSLSSLKYEAESPDEVALCNFAKAEGFVLVERKKNIDVKLFISGKEVHYTLLITLEFSSDRRRSSVFVRSPEGKIVMYSKGADNVMFARLSKESKKLKKITTQHVEDFSVDGLRTLALCKKDLTEEQFAEFQEEYRKAASSLTDREKKVEKVADAMERDLTLLGCTAIEDKLQDGVPEAIAYFIAAGIKFWIITGDKQETAINIAKSCNLIQDGVTITKINVKSDDECGEAIKTALATVTASSRSALVIDGFSLNFALTKEHEPQLLEVCKHCEAVVCNRTTPLQKALVVRMVKRGVKAISLSIGDGANDVSMLQEADIGVGLFGKEGSQAARSGDYALHMFKHLLRLVCVHGRYSLIRSAGLVQYSFYKNMAMFIVQLWFAIFSLFSAQTLYDGIVMAVFNVIITFLPPFFFALFERDIPEEAILQNPRAYRQIMRGDHSFSIVNFSYWIASAAWHSVVIFFYTYLLYMDSDIIHTSGRNMGFWEVGTTTSSIGVVCVALMMALHMTHWNWISHLGVWVSLVGYFLLILIESHLVSYLPTMYYVFDTLFSSANFVFSLVLVPVICLLPNYTFLFMRRMYHPKDWQIYQEGHHYGKKTIGELAKAEHSP